jgi:hypothetical protein
MSVRTISVVLLFVSSISNLTADEPTWNTVAAGVSESLHQVELKCDFAYRRGIAYNSRDAECGVFSKRDGTSSQGDSAVGTLVKQGVYSRIRLIYEQPTDFRLRGRSGFSTASQEISGGNSILVSYYPKQMNIEGEVVGGDGSVLQDSRVREWYDILPLCPDLRFAGVFSLLSIPGVLPADFSNFDVEAKARVVTQTEEEIVFELVKPSGEIVKLSVGVDEHYPFVKRVESEWQTVIYEDFVKLPCGFLFPRNVTTVNGPYDPDSPMPFWIGHRWHATTISAEVREEDFDVVFAAGSEVGGLTKIFNPLKIGKNPNSSEFGNVGTSETADSLNPRETQPVDASNGWLRMTGLGIVLVALGVLSFCILRAIWRSAASASLAVLIVITLVGCGSVTEQSFPPAQPELSNTNHDPVIDPELIHSFEYDEEKLVVTESLVSRGVEDGVNFLISDASIRINEGVRSSFRESVTFFGNGQKCSIDVERIVKTFISDRRQVFLRSNGESQTTIRLQLHAGGQPGLIDYNKTSIDVNLVKVDEKTVNLVIVRKICQAFETHVKVWSVENFSTEPDLIIPVYCL